MTCQSKNRNVMFDSCLTLPILLIFNEGLFEVKKTLKISNVRK